MTNLTAKPASASQVRLGATAPALPKAESSKVRLGATSPMLLAADASKLRGS